MRQVSDRLPHSPRSDARDNRARILDVARTVFATEGFHVPTREIARRAEVGPATLYRHFPTKQALAVEAFRDRFQQCQAIVEHGLADPDPWRGFCSVVEEICELHASDRGYTAAFRSAYPEAMDFGASRRHTLAAVARLARRAKEAGRLRADFVVDDLVLMLVAHRGIEAVSPTAGTAPSRRFAQLALRAFQAVPEPAP